MADFTTTQTRLPYDIICCILDYVDFESLKGTTLASRAMQEAADRLLWKHTRFSLSGTLEPSFKTIVSNIILRRARMMESLRLTTVVLPSQGPQTNGEALVQCSLAIIDTLTRMKLLRSFTMQLEGVDWMGVRLIIRRYRDISVESGGLVVALHLSLSWLLGREMHRCMKSILALHPNVRELTLDMPTALQNWHEFPGQSHQQEGSKTIPWETSSLPHLETLLCQDIETLRIATSLPNPSPLREIHITQAVVVESFHSADTVTYIPHRDRLIPLLTTFSPTLKFVTLKLRDEPRNTELHLPLLIALLREAVPSLPLLQSLQVDTRRSSIWSATFMGAMATGDIVSALSHLETRSSSPPSLSNIKFSGLAYSDTKEFADRMFDALSSLGWVCLDELDDLQWELGEPATPKVYKRVGGTVVETTEQWLD